MISTTNRTKALLLAAALGCALAMDLYEENFYGLPKCACGNFAGHLGPNGITLCDNLLGLPELGPQIFSCWNQLELCNACFDGWLQTADTPLAQRILAAEAERSRGLEEDRLRGIDADERCVMIRGANSALRRALQQTEAGAPKFVPGPDGPRAQRCIAEQKHGQGPYSGACVACVAQDCEDRLAQGHVFVPGNNARACIRDREHFPYRTVTTVPICSCNEGPYDGACDACVAMDYVPPAQH